MVAANSFVYFPEDVLDFLKGNTLHEDARGGVIIQVVADEDESFASPDNASSFSTLGVNMWWKLELLDEVDEQNSLVFFDHQHFSDCGLE